MLNNFKWLNNPLLTNPLIDKGTNIPQTDVKSEETLSFLDVTNLNFNTAGVGSGLSFIKPLVRTKEESPTRPEVGIKPEVSVKANIPKGTAPFNQAFDNVERRIPGIRKYRAFLTDLAARESSFRPDARAKNKSGTALGYFQFMPFNRKGINEEEFVNNPELQIEMAWKLLNDFKNSFTKYDWEAANDKGYSESAMIAGAWLGGARGVKRLLHSRINTSDNLGTSVKNYMDNFNNII